MFLVSSVASNMMSGKRENIVLRYVHDRMTHKRSDGARLHIIISYQTARARGESLDK